MNTLQKKSKNIDLIKSFDTKISDIEKEYDISLGHSRMKFGNYLKIKGYPSLSKMLKS